MENGDGAAHKLACCRASAPIAKWEFEELDPLLIVSIVEEWKKQEHLKYVVADEAEMLSLPP